MESSSVQLNLIFCVLQLLILPHLFTAVQYKENDDPSYNISEERSYQTPYAQSTLLPSLLKSLSRQKRAPHTSKIDQLQNDYDYIVIGSGPGGATVASRLSELSCVSVLVLEAGKSPPLLTDIPAIARAFVGSDIDWNYFTVPQAHTAALLNDRKVQFPSAKVLGGSSVINAMLYVRGNKKNYDDWAAGGAEGWSYKEVLPYFMKSENNSNPDFVDPGYHGYKGPIKVEMPRYYPELQGALYQAALSLGYPIRDVNGRFQRGFFAHQASMGDGQRCSAAKAYLAPVDKRPNLDILQKAFVTKVIIENKQAVGVQFDFGGERHEVRARKEVILSAGTVNTAKLLMLSGIGPKSHLEDLKIPVLVDLPVGENLQDHCAPLSAYEISDDFSPFLNQISDPENIERYINTRTGPLSSTEGVVTFAFLNNKEPVSASAVPDQELYLMWGSSLVAGNQTNIKQEAYQAIFQPYDNNNTYWCVPQNLHPLSRGTVTLNSTDPYDPPNIDPNYLAHPEDLEDVVAGMKHCNAIAASEPMKRIGVKPVKTVYPNCAQFVGDEDKYLECQAQSLLITLSHPVGTAKMGHRGDPTTVVDPKLRVKGIKSLRVVDASVMPLIPTGNTNIPTTMVAEKAADIIKKTITCTN